MITKVFGAPGTGKTAWLIDKVEELHHTTPLENVCFISWSTSAIEEVRQRLGVSKKDLPYFNTLHGVCLSLAMLNDEEFKEKAKHTFSLRNFVASWQRKFCFERGIPFDPQATGASDLLGNVAFSLYSKAVGSLYPKTHDVEACLKVVDVENPNLAWIISDWLKFKKQNGIIDFEDILIEVFEKELFPPTDFVVLDEAQDLNRLEYEIVQRFISTARDSFIAGDDDQAIHAWKGAKASFFLELKADEEVVLPKSHRVPEKIFSFALSIIEAVTNRREKRISPSRSGGHIRILPGAYEIADVTRLVARLATSYPRKSFFLLFRTNQMVKSAESELLSLAIPFRNLKGNSIWERDLLLAWNAIAKTKKRLPLTTDELKWVLDNIKGYFTEAEKEALINATQKGNIPLSYYQISPHIRNLIDEQKVDETVLSIVERANQPISPESVNLWVDTIHASKGREADVVILVDAITSTTEWSIKTREGFEDECRVFYVGTTRAREALFIVRLARFSPFLGGVVA